MRSIVVCLFIVLVSCDFQARKPAKSNEGCLQAIRAIAYHLRNQNTTRTLRVLQPVVDRRGVLFALDLPNARSIELLTDFNGWKEPIPLERNQLGIWRVRVKDMKPGAQYKYKIVDYNGNVQYRFGPYESYLYREADDSPWNAIVWDQKSYKWADQNFTADSQAIPLEVYPGTIIPDKPNANFREIADYLVENYRDKVNAISFMPVTQHNVKESWGYQVGSLFSVDYRHGDPDDLKYMIDKLHQNKIAVYFDLVYGHASKDWDTGIAMLDGTRRFFKEGVMGMHPTWKTYIFDYDDPKVRDYLLSNLKYWIENFHIDGARLDAVSSMTYLDFDRASYQWIGHALDGGNVDHGAIKFLQELNQLAHRLKPNFVTIAEDTSESVLSTKAIEKGGMGFDYRWGLGTMYKYFDFWQAAPAERSLDDLYAVFSPEWDLSQRYINQIHNHDMWDILSNVIAGEPTKKERFAISRMMFTQIYMDVPGRPMLFTGDEFMNPLKWNHDTPAKVSLRNQSLNAAHERYIVRLGEIYRTEKAFENVDMRSAEVFLNNDEMVSIVKRDDILILSNWSDQNKVSLEVDALSDGQWKLLLNSDERKFGGNGVDLQLDSSGKINLPAYSKIIFRKI